MKNPWTSLWAITLLLMTSGALADERINRFASEIEIRPDGSLLVVETIDVQAEGQNIRRGIYRDFPTVYRDALGNRVTVPFEVVAVARDGNPESWHTESVTGGTRLYIGDADTYLQPGQYSYRIEYATDRQLGYFDEHDELYWNVTGNDWAFPIESVEATVRLPAEVPREQIRIDAYLGEAGAKGTQWTSEVPAAGIVRFSNQRPLRPYEGMTVAVGFPKGLVPEPSVLDRGARLLSDSVGSIIGLIGLLVVIGWQAWAWSRVGRDPLPGAIYPRYEPPAGYSPGMLRYVLKYGYDKTATAAALVHLAVNKHLKLDKPGKHYVVTKDGGQPESKTERKLFNALFAGGSSLTFKQSEHARVGKAVKAHEKALRGRMDRDYFDRNRRWWVPGLIISGVTVIAMVAMTPTDEPGLGLFLTFFATVWNGIVGLFLFGLLKGWKQARGLAVMPLLLAGAFMIPFVAAGVSVLGILAWQIGPLPTLILVAHIAITATFYQLMKAPTQRGRDLLDAIQGLQLYLTVAEREDLERRHGGEHPVTMPVTIEEFERLLPYAIALDSAETWGTRFEDAIRKAEIDGTIQTRSWYSPSMVSGGALSGAAISSSLAGGLSSGISGSASPPGSSSGGGGGGSSGGGGGGGGGGGW